MWTKNCKTLSGLFNQLRSIVIFAAPWEINTWIISCSFNDEYPLNLEVIINI